ncbi:MAG: sigma-70 family RNA polymerase sigma factor [Hymenobacteraceae bacterium]|nr:sigma-70 family RNA polymerase sigma factor [Hymenobacteraceae bacterium]
MPQATFSDHLLTACRHGEPAAQEALYAWFAPRLLAVCGRYCRSAAQAEDLVQETFVRVFQLLPTFRGTGVLDAWVRRIAVTLCLDHYRACARHWYDVDLDHAASLTSDDTDALTQLSEQELLDLIARLPDGYRVVLNLYCIEGYSHAEIAAQLGIEERTSSSQLSKARRLLAQLVRRADTVSRPRPQPLVI